MCGVSLYPTEGPDFFAEHAATNPQAPATLAHRGFEKLIAQVRVYAALRAKYPVLLIRHRSILRMLSKQGFRSMEGIAVTCDPVAP